MKIKDIAKKINDQIVQEMEKGVVPWTCPWERNFPNGKAMAVNGSSKRAYTNCNYFYMNYLAQRVFDNNEFFTFNQIMKLGGKLKKDASGVAVVEVFPIINKVETMQDGEIIEVDKVKKCIKLQIVYNRSDIDGLPEVKKAKNEFKKLENFEKIEAAEKVISEYKTCPEIKHQGRQACYIPAKDVVEVPKKELFKNEFSYYSTLFHELIHSTGAKKRLDREKGLIFGDEKYSREELVAELGASYLRSYCGIDTVTEFQQSAAYIDGWLKALKKDEKMFLTASMQAIRAVNYILNQE